MLIKPGPGHNLTVITLCLVQFRVSHAPLAVPGRYDTGTIPGIASCYRAMGTITGDKQAESLSYAILRSFGACVFFFLLEPFPPKGKWHTKVVTQMWTGCKGKHTRPFDRYGEREKKNEQLPKTFATRHGSASTHLVLASEP